MKQSNDVNQNQKSSLTGSMEDRGSSLRGVCRNGGQDRLGDPGWTKDPGNALPPRIMIAAPKSGSGKTTLTCGLIGALARRGRKVISFKCGPDYIDPMFHRSVLGVRAGNLDSFFTPGNTLPALMSRRSVGSDLAVIEGVMGFYDGLGGTTDRGSSYEISRLTGTPVILTIDAKGASATLVPIIRGLMEYRKDAGIRGIILNRVSGSFYERIKNLLEEELGIPVLGYLPENSKLVVPSRHLGLVTPDVRKEQSGWVEAVTDAVLETVDVDAVVRLAEQAAGRRAVQTDGETGTSFSEFRGLPHLDTKVRIAVARDEAFSFSYAENEELLEMMGAELVPFSPLHDEKLPENISGLFLPGGYPEQCAKELEENRTMRVSVREAVKGGLPTIAECGGFLYLQKYLTAADGKKYEMAGVLDSEAAPAGHLVRFGYAVAESMRPGLFGRAHLTFPVHEFHYWETTEIGDGFCMTKPTTGKQYREIVYTNTLLAGFPHFYLWSNPEAAFSFLKVCEKQAEVRRV